MFGLDDSIAGLGAGAGLAVALLIAVLLGLRHATDPDHLTAVSTLILGDRKHGTRRAAALGLAWGLGHAVTLAAFGLPVVLLGRYLPDSIHRAAELVIAVLIVALALRLLIRWQRGYFHVHVHAHGDVVHAHPHVHEGGAEHAHTATREHEHEHEHAGDLGRTPLAAFGIGLVHGAGGSAGASIVLVGAVSSGGAAAASALLLFAAATAVSMAAASTLVGAALVRPAVRRRIAASIPFLAAVSLLFGLWYGLGALEAVPHAF